MYDPALLPQAVVLPKFPWTCPLGTCVMSSPSATRVDRLADDRQSFQLLCLCVCSVIWHRSSRMDELPTPLQSPSILGPAGPDPAGTFAALQAQSLQPEANLDGSAQRLNANVDTGEGEP